MLEEPKTSHWQKATTETAHVFPHSYRLAIRPVEGLKGPLQVFVVI